MLWRRFGSRRERVEGKKVSSATFVYMYLLSKERKLPADFFVPSRSVISSFKSPTPSRRRRSSPPSSFNPCTLLLQNTTTTKHQLIDSASLNLGCSNRRLRPRPSRPSLPPSETTTTRTKKKPRQRSKRPIPPLPMDPSPSTNHLQQPPLLHQGLNQQQQHPNQQARDCPSSIRSTRLFPRPRPPHLRQPQRRQLHLLKRGRSNRRVMVKIGTAS